MGKILLVTVGRANAVEGRVKDGAFTFSFLMEWLLASSQNSSSFFSSCTFCKHTFSLLSGFGILKLPYYPQDPVKFPLEWFEEHSHYL